MADYTITAEQTGSYQIALPAGEIVTVRIEWQYPSLGQQIRVFALAGSTPVFARPGTHVTVGDPMSMIVPISTWSDMWFAENGDLALISDADATAAVSRG